MNQPPSPLELQNIQILSRGQWHPFAGEGAILPEDAAIGSANGRWAYITAEGTRGIASTEAEAKQAAARAVAADVFRRWGFPALAQALRDGDDGARRALAAALKVGGGP